MEGRKPFLSAVYAELTRRKVLRSVGAYAVAVFAILQLMDAAVEPLRLPDWFPTLVTIGLILLFPIVFMLAWRFDFTGGRILKTEASGDLSRGQSLAGFMIMLLATAGMGWGFFNYYGDVLEEAPAVVQAESTGQDFSAPQNSIAVLPFADLSEEGNQAHFSDGVAEEILNLLAQVDGLHVAARTSSFAFRDPQKSIRDIGRLLNVSTVLEGSIRKVGNRVRLTAQLINVEDGYHIWSQSYDRELDDVFAIQDEVASSIATALVDSFDGLQEKTTGRTQNLAAFEAFRTGRLHWWRRSPQEIQQAIELFAKALEHDPQFAPAYAAIADSLLLLSSYGNIPQMRAIERAQPMIEKALALDPESAEAFAALGLARWQIGQNDAAESSLRQAIRLNGDYIPARLWLGGLLGELGRIPEQGLVLQEAMALDPLNELLAINYAGNLFVQGNYDDAQALLVDLVQLRPDSPTLLRTLAGYALAHGDLVEGWRYARRSYLLAPESPVVVTTMAKAWMALGEYEESERMLREAMDTWSDNAELKSQYFFLQLVAGRLEEAEQVVKEQFGPDVESLPERFQRFYHFQMGMIRVQQGELEAARDAMERAINLDQDGMLDDNQLFILSMAALLNKQLGHEELAAERLTSAERAVHRARVNGVDDPGIYYNEAIIQVLKGENGNALDSLEQAFERGWREAWVLKIDGRLDPLREDSRFIDLTEKMKDLVEQARSEVSELKVAWL
jgi:TolB-like protein/Tfp pilus assembly protein PilF